MAKFIFSLQKRQSIFLFFLDRKLYTLVYGNNEVFYWRLSWINIQKLFLCSVAGVFTFSFYFVAVFLKLYICVCVCVCVCACVCLRMHCHFSHVQFFVTLWAVPHQAPLSMGILQARILEWVAMPSSRGSSKRRDWTQVSHTAGRIFTIWATRKAHSGGYV